MSKRRIFAALLVIGLVATACGSASDSAEVSFDRGFEDASADFETATTIAASSEEPAADADAAAPELGSASTPVVKTAQEVGRDIIFTASTTIAVNNVDDSAQTVIDIVASHGGFVFGQDTVGLPTPQTTLVFKVDPDEFQPTLADLADVGEIRSQVVNADDVTEIVVDLQSQIDTAEASVERLRALLVDAADLEQVVQIEEQLLARETQLERLRGSLRTLRDAVNLATITVTLTEALSQPRLTVGMTGYAGHDDNGDSCPGGGLQLPDNDAAATVCWEIFNNGDTPLADIALTDTILDVSLEDLTVVFGDPNEILEPGQSIILAYQIEPERSLRYRSRITASPVNRDGEVLDARNVSVVSEFSVGVFDPGGRPGFGDGLDGGVEVALWTWSGLRLATGFIVGITPVLLAVAGLWWWRRDRKRRRNTPPAHPAAVTDSTSAENEEE